MVHKGKRRCHVADETKRPWVYVKRGFTSILLINGNLNQHFELRPLEAKRFTQTGYNDIPVKLHQNHFPFFITFVGNRKLSERRQENSFLA